jgi:hypothetical protein
MHSIKHDAANVKIGELTSQLDAAKLLGVNVWKIARLIDAGKLEGVRLPTGTRAVLKASLERYQRGQK